MTVHELRKNGYKVRVIHIREKIYKLIKVELEESYDFFYSPIYLGQSSKGGKTVIHLRTPEGEEFVGVSYCHPEDNYNKKEGVKKALQRALEQADHV